MQSLGTFWLFTKNQAQSTKHILFYIISVWRHYRRSTDLKKFQYQPIGLKKSEYRYGVLNRSYWWIL